MGLPESHWQMLLSECSEKCPQTCMHPNVVAVRTVSDTRPQLQCRTKLTLAAPPLLLHGIATRVVVQSVYFDQLSAERSRELFDEFVEKWNAGDLSSKYYDMVPVSVHRTHTRTHPRTHVHTYTRSNHSV